MTQTEKDQKKQILNVIIWSIRKFLSASFLFLTVSLSYYLIFATSNFQEWQVYMMKVNETQILWGKIEKL